MIGINKILLAVTVIAALAAAITLFMMRPYGNDSQSYKIAIFQISSHPSTKEAIKGFESKFKQNYLYSDKKVEFKYFNPELNPATSKSMAQEILSGKYDMVATFSTPALQTIARHNRAGTIPHVFGVANDPYSAGVGISLNDDSHPPHLTGLATPPPVERTFQLARSCNPGLKIAGTIVNPNDPSSMICLKKARNICKKLGIKLEVVSVSSPAQVESAAKKLLSKRVEAVFTGGDNTVGQCVKDISNVLGPKGIPIFAYIPSHITDGAVLGLGASYFEIGRIMAAIAIEIINGKPSAEIPVKNITPMILAINLKVAKTLKPNWKIPQKVIDNASVLLKDTGDDAASSGFSPLHHRARRQLPDNRKLPRICYINFGYEYQFKETLNGFLAGMKRQGMVLGKTYELQIFNADKNVKKVESMLKKASSSPDCDIILLTSQPALVAALKTVQEKPVVFAAIASPFTAGAGKSSDDHRKNFTGVFSGNGFKKMIKLIKQCFPKARRIGSLYNPYDISSETRRKLFARELRSANLQFIAVPSSSTERFKWSISQLIDSKVDVICQLGDHLHTILFPAISSAARSAHIPILGLLSANVQNDGTVIAVIPDYEDGGRIQAKITIQIINGTVPAKIPFQQIKRNQLIINRKNAEYYNVDIPEKILKQADMIIE